MNSPFSPWHRLQAAGCYWLTQLIRPVSAVFAFGIRGIGVTGCCTALLAVAAPAGVGPNIRVRGRIYQAARLTTAAPVIDGHFDDACWIGLDGWAGDFIQREPHEGAKGSLPTELKVLYDNQAVYVAIRAHDPAVATKPRLTGARDEFTGDMVGINFDSYNRQRAGFEFDVTSGGSKIDLILRNDGSVDTSWNAVWEVKTAVEAGAWTAEFRIPLSQLRYHTGAGQIWGMHCWRWIGALQEESNWNLIPMDNHGWLYSFGELHGLRDLPASRRLEIVPYAIAKVRRNAAEPGNPFRTGRDSSMSGGLDVKYGLGSNVTLDLTVNPDFSQVDADPSEINLSTVETFHRERRPFFLEGKDSFDFPLDDDRAFYTRRIGDAPRLQPPVGVFHDLPDATRILGAAKLTGTTQTGLTVGLLHAIVDRTTTRVFDADGYRQLIAEPRTNDSVLRLQQDFAGGNTRVGALFASSLRSGSAAELQTLPRRALTFGADATQYFSNRTYFVEGRVLGTSIQGSPAAITALRENPVHNYQRPDADYLDIASGSEHLTGNAGYLRTGKATGDWRANGFVSWRSPGVDFNDLGYLQVADFVAPGVQVQYYDATAGALLRRRDLRLKYTEPRNYGGERLGRNLTLETEFATISGAYLSTKVTAETALLDLHVLRGGPALRLADRYRTDLYFETKGGQPLQFKFSGGASRSAEPHSLWLRGSPEVVWKPGDRLAVGFSVDYSRNRQSTQYAGVASGSAAPVYVMGGLNQHVIASTLKLTMNFSPTMSLSYYGGPFATTGRYADFKAVTRPRASARNERFEALALQAGGGFLAGRYRGADLRMDNPDFNWREFKSNLVFRWEYRAGAFLYCVWSQYRSDAEDIGGFSPGAQYRQLFATHPDNTFLIKFSYWFSI